jgi:poly-gamma-glutamate capsule biosynthesis protein CapA/YwtB (metallophosphatase superfamily)
MKKILLIFSLICGAAILSFSTIYSRDISLLSADLANTFSKAQPGISIIFTGDVMVDRGVELKMTQNNDWNWPFNLLNIKADLIVGNLESQISDKGRNIGSIYSFRAETETMKAIKEAGFNIVDVNNNHFNDYTQEAFLDSLNRLKDSEIDYFGGGKNESEAFSPLIKNIQGTKIAFLGYMDLGPESWKAQGNKSGVAWIKKSDFDRVAKDISKAKEQADIVIVSMHAGVEYVQELTSFQTELAKTAIDAGADLIIGHHPHVVQRYEMYKGKYIFYSLGNFVFDQYFSEETMTGRIVKVIIKNKKIKNISIQESKQNEDFQVYLTNKILKIK